MSIVFFCPQCGARFEVGEQAAGKVGRCKRCGERIAVPPPTPVAVGAAAGASMTRADAAGAATGAPAWLERMTSQVALAPLTIEKMPGLRKPAPKPSPLDDLGDSKPYGLVENYKIPAVERGRSAGAAGEVKIAWRWGLGSIQKTFRRLNEFAYLISVPFIMIMLMGATARNRSMALFGAEVVVLLNIGRIVTGLANILAVPFREGPVTGLLFLFPPYTIKYMIDHWNKLRRPVRRVAMPMLTIALVVLAFLFLPSLSKTSAAKAGDSETSSVQGR
ncbi:hypothetical protein [Paludisphaera soli]|uniref:hypothetical protein n=1 Tax=Paludisphaera soli TaxID=2712865 RepID=UPI0013EB1CB9|nr:hypothetical protein [Paludisphaera soli]